MTPTILQAYTAEDQPNTCDDLRDRVQYAYLEFKAKFQHYIGQLFCQKKNAADEALANKNVEILLFGKMSGKKVG